MADDSNNSVPTLFGVDPTFWALLLVLWDEAPRNEKQERKNISKRQKNIEHGGENSYHAQCYVFEVLEN